MENKGALVWWAIIILAVGGIVYYNFFNKEKEPEPETQTVEKPSETDLAMRALADKHGAILADKDTLTYTIQAQDRFLAGKPVVFDTYVDDVFRRDGKTYVRFESYGDFVLELQCDERLVNDKILSQVEPEDEFSWLFYDEYLVVANVSEVSKPVMKLDATASSEEDAEIEVDASNIFSVNGTCVDIQKVELE